VSYVDDLAQAIRHQVPPGVVPACDTAALFRLYAVLALAKGEAVDLEDVHDAWSAWMSARNPDHKALRPLEELPRDVRSADEPYLTAIHAVARHRGIGRGRTASPATRGGDRWSHSEKRLT
jgi:hypothetical protein